MSSTTIKIEDKLLRGIRVVKPAEQSVSAWVRETLEGEIRRRQMLQAAEKYQAFLMANPDEGDELDEWESAALDRPPKTRRR